MDYNPPGKIVGAMIDAGAAKAALFIIPTGIMLGAKVTVSDWWTGNQIPSTVGNLVGGGLFTGLLLYWTHRPKGDTGTPKTG